MEKKKTNKGRNGLLAKALYFSSYNITANIYFKVAGCIRLLGFPKQMDVMQKNVR